MPVRPSVLSALLLITLITAGACAAQERPALTPDQEAALYGIPVAVAVGGTLLLLNVAEENPVQSLILTAPLAAGAAACAAGRLTGAAGSCRGAFVGGAMGALPGLAVAGAGYALGVSGLYDGWASVGVVLLGAVAYVAVPPFTAPAGYRRGARTAVAPTAFRGPSGEVTPGLSLRAHF
jgi:hypothetical protein